MVADTPLVGTMDKVYVPAARFVMFSVVPVELPTLVPLAFLTVMVRPPPAGLVT